MASYDSVFLFCPSLCLYIFHFLFYPISDQVFFASFTNSYWYVPWQRSGQAKYVPNGHQHEINNASLTSSGSNSQGTEMLSSMLAAATPQQQKQILGERLFPLVEKLKVTFSLMDNYVFSCV